MRRTCTISLKNIVLGNTGGCTPNSDDDFVIKIHLYKNNNLVKTLPEMIIKYRDFDIYNHTINFDVSDEELQNDFYLEFYPKACPDNSVKVKEKYIPINLSCMFQITSTNTKISAETVNNVTTLKYLSIPENRTDRDLATVRLAIFLRQRELLQLRGFQKKDIIDNTKVYIEGKEIGSFEKTFYFSEAFDIFYADVNVNVLEIDKSKTITVKYRDTLVGTHTVSCIKDETAIVDMHNSIELETPAGQSEETSRRIVIGGTSERKTIDYYSCNDCIKYQESDSITLNMISSVRDNRFFTIEEVKKKGITVNIINVNTNESKKLTEIKGDYLGKLLNLRQIKDLTGFDLLESGSHKIEFIYNGDGNKYGSYEIATTKRKKPYELSLVNEYSRTKENVLSNVVTYLHTNFYYETANGCGAQLYYDKLDFEYDVKIYESDSNLPESNWTLNMNILGDYMYTLADKILTEPEGTIIGYFDINYNKITKAFFKIKTKVKIKTICGEIIEVENSENDVYTK